MSKKIIVTPKESATPGASFMDPLGPMRVEMQLYYLVHWEDTKNCPKSVHRCQECLGPFTNAEVVIVKTMGVREFTARRTGKQKR